MCVQCMCDKINNRQLLRTTKGKKKKKAQLISLKNTTAMDDYGYLQWYIGPPFIS